MGQNGAEQPTGLSVAREAPDSVRVSRNQENHCGKDLTEQSGELGTCRVRVVSDHEGDEQSGVNWVTTRAQNGHEGKEQSVAGRAV